MLKHQHHCEWLFHIKGEYENLFWKGGVCSGNRHHPVFWPAFPVFALQVLSYTTFLKYQFTISKNKIMNQKTMWEADNYTSGRMTITEIRFIIFLQVTNFTKGKTARITKMMAMFVLFSSYVLSLSLLLSGSKVTLACENSLAKHWRNWTLSESVMVIRPPAWSISTQAVFYLWVGTANWRSQRTVNPSPLW